MGRVLGAVAQPAFWVGMACGAVIGGGILWRFDLRSAPSAELSDARRAAQMAKWEVVRGTLGRYLRRFPEDPEAQILLSRALAAQGDFDGCLSWLGKVSDHSTWSGEARLREAQAQLMRYFGARAEQSYLRAIALGLDGHGSQQIVDAARFGLVQIYGLEVRYDEARAQLRQVLRTTEQPAAVLSLFIQIEALGTEPNQAIESLLRFVNQDPTDFEARCALGHHYVVTSQFNEARPLLEDCLRERPQNLHAAKPLVQCLIDSADFDACRTVLENLGEPAREQAWYWRQLGYLREQSLDWPGAAECYETAVKLAPYDPLGYHVLAAVLNRLQQSDRAAALIEQESDLRAARQQLPDLYAKLLATGAQSGGPGPDPDLCYVIGRCYRALGLTDADEWFHEALARNPNHLPSRTALEQKASDEVRSAESPTTGNRDPEP